MTADPSTKARSVEGILHALCRKYKMIVALHKRREEAIACGMEKFEPAEARQRRDSMRQLAQRFPGALREMESLDLPSLHQRYEEVGTLLSTVESAGDEHSVVLPFWIQVVWAYHSDMRRVLDTKKWLAQQSSESLPEELLRSYNREINPDNPVTQDFLNAISKPPSGRLQGVVWKRLEQQFSCTQTQVEKVIFGK